MKPTFVPPPSWIGKSRCRWRGAVNRIITGHSTSLFRTGFCRDLPSKPASLAISGVPHFVVQSINRVVNCSAHKREVSMSYRLEGTLLEVCNCEVLCPCWIGDPRRKCPQHQKRSKTGGVLEQVFERAKLFKSFAEKSRFKNDRY